MLATASMDEGEGPSVDLDNEAAPGQTVLRVTGRRDAASLARVAQVLADQGMSIRSAAIGSQGGGDVYHLTTRAGGAVAADAWPPLRDALLRVLLHTTRSSKPSIHGAAVDVDARALKAVASEADAAALESAAREMAAAAEALVGVEREIIAAGDEVSTNDLLAKQAGYQGLGGLGGWLQGGSMGYSRGAEPGQGIAQPPAGLRLGGGRGMIVRSSLNFGDTAHDLMFVTLTLSCAVPLTPPTPTTPNDRASGTRPRPCWSGAWRPWRPS